MPEAVSFTVTTYRKLAKGETGLTRLGSSRLVLADAISWVLQEMPDDAFRIAYLDADGNELPDEIDVSDYCRLDIDWTKVPESVRDPKLPARRR
jgi:hypothetical protein